MSDPDKPLKERSPSPTYGGMPGVWRAERERVVAAVPTPDGERHELVATCRPGARGEGDAGRIAAEHNAHGELLAALARLADAAENVINGTGDADTALAEFDESLLLARTLINKVIGV